MKSRVALLSLPFLALLFSFGGCEYDGARSTSGREGVAPAFDVVETTIADVHAAMEAGELTSRQLVEAYLARIEAYDGLLNSLIVVNPGALERADELDALFARSGLSGPLHGIPVIVKDNYDTHDLPTTAGSASLAGSIPPDDAFQVRRIRAAGAIVLAKSNMAEFAFSPYVTVGSRLPGYTRNPYAPNRVTAGSSGGTAAAVAANLGVVGLGTDTGNSIRGPSSHNMLVGIRSTMGLTSRDGIVPLYLDHDVGGPMCRTVADAVAVFDVIAGTDPADAVTAEADDRRPPRYADHLVEDGLRGARIGVVRQLSITPTTHPGVRASFEEALVSLRRAGADVVDVHIAELDDIPGDARWCPRFAYDMDRYLASLGDGAPVASLQEIHDGGRFHPTVRGGIEFFLTVAGPPEENQACRTAWANGRKLAAGVRRVLAADGLDALVYPTWSNPPRLIGDMQSPAGDNSQDLSPHTGFPAITVPMGFSAAGGPGLPAGITFVGDAWTEPRLIELAYGFERAVPARVPPDTAPRSETDVARTVHTTACPRNCYSTCGMRVTVEDGRLRTIAAHDANDATSEGVCLKGQSYVERVYAAERLLRPLKRVKSGFEPIAWDEALDTIAERLATCRERWGARSVLFYSGSGTKGLLNGVSLDFWRLFGGCTTTYGDLCWPAGLEATRLTLGDNKHNAPADLANARLIVLWGKNAAETNIHQMRFVEQARARGARVVVIDPRRTQTAEAAHLLVQPRPGTDGALALGIAHGLVARGAVDEAFVERHVHGFDAFRALVADWDPLRTATVAGVDVADVERLVDEIATGAPVSICAGFGMQRYTNSAQAMRAMLALLAITGNIGKPGAGWIFANLQSDVFSTVKDPLAFYPPDAEDEDPVRVSVSTALLGRQMREQRDPPLKAVWVERGNPVTQNPHTGEVLDAFRALDFRVVVDQFMTDTAREADIVLPAKTMFEQTDVIGAYWHAYLQIKQKLIDPPGEVKPETEIYGLLARRLGLPEDEVGRRIPAPTDAAVEAYLTERLARFPGLTLDRLREAPQLAPGCEPVAFADLSFPTPSGRIELSSQEAADRWAADPLPVYREQDEAPGRGAGLDYTLYLLTPNTKDRIHSQFGNLPSIRRLAPHPVVHLHPADAASRGIASGDRVRVFNDRGSLTLEARFDHGLRPGCVSIVNGWWLSEGGGVNLLSAARETDMAHGAAFHDNAVEVVPL